MCLSASRMNFLLLLIPLIINTHLVAGNPYRLPNFVTPSLYSLKIHPDLDLGSFTGEVSIHITAKSPVNSIFLHACSNLTITDLLLNQRKANYTIYQHFELIEIFGPKDHEIPQGNHLLHIKYNGSLLNKVLGFFRATFTDKNETLSYLVVTDFQPTYARRAFPCFDEPAFKARFQVTLIAPNDTYKALSNMRKIASFPTTDGIVHKFETTCVMSTYLLAFALTQYSSGQYNADSSCSCRLPIGIYSFNATDENSKEPMQYAVEALKFLTDYTDFEYPLPKLDLIEYDREQSGATENWGFITARTGVLSPYSKIFQDSQISNIIAHEVAHFWFGNLVTNYWWDDIWLQEAFAEFFALKIEEKILDDNATLSFPTQYLEDVYLFDQTRQSKPIVHFLETPGEIEKHFNDVTYSKGAAVLRMIEMVLGEQKFQRAIRSYIKNFAYSTATTDDFISIIEQVNCTVDLRGFIETFLYQNRFPLIQVSEQEDAYVLRQVSCRLDENDDPSPFGYRWTIPVTYVTSLKSKPTLVWFDKDMEKVTISKNNETWIKFNHKQIGYYRMNYSESLLDKFLQHGQTLDLYDMEHLLTEAVHLYQTNIISCDVVLKLTDHFSNFTNALPLTPVYIMNIYLKSGGLKQDKEAYENYKNFLYSVLSRAGLDKTIKKKEKTQRVVPYEMTERVKICAKWIKENLPKTQFRSISWNSD